MLEDEKQLSEAIMRGDSCIELSDYLASGVEKIKNPSTAIWKSVAAGLLASSLFWGSTSAFILGFTLGLPAILTICGGVSGIVFVTLGARGTVFAYRMLVASKTMIVLSKLRDNYEMQGNTLFIKK